LIGLYDVHRKSKTNTEKDDYTENCVAHAQATQPAAGPVAMVAAKETKAKEDGYYSLKQPNNVMIKGKPNENDEENGDDFMYEVIERGIASGSYEFADVSPEPQRDGT